MQNHKIETNSELIYEDGSIWSTLIFIKIISSDTHVKTYSDSVAVTCGVPQESILVPLLFLCYATIW